MTIQKPARLSQQLAIEFPIIQAPLYHGGSTELVAAISNNGGLGMIAGGLLTPEALQHEIQEVKALTDKPFAVNLLVASENSLEEQNYVDAINRLKGFAGAEAIELDALNTEAWALSPLEELLDILLEEEVSAVSFSFGIPEQEILDILKDSGMKVIGNSTHMIEALLWEERGVDIHYLQGLESGGMRFTFIGDALQNGFSMQTLVAQANRLLEKPFVISGGIYNKPLFASAMIQGADGVAIGTAFMLTEEAGLSHHEADKILQSNEYDSVFTQHWTGIMGRCLSNTGTQELRKVRGKTLPFPEQLFLAHAATLDELEIGDSREEFQPIWASVNASLCSRTSVKSLMDTLVS